MEEFASPIVAVFCYTLFVWNGAVTENDQPGDTVDNVTWIHNEEDYEKEK